MKVMHVVLSLGEGGAESNLYYLLRYLSKHKTDDHSFALCLLKEEGTFGQFLKASISVQVLRLSKFDFSVVPRLVSLFRHSRYDIVHVHLFPEIYYVAAASLLARYPIYVMTEHNVWNRRRSRAWLRPAEQWVYGRYTHITTVGKNTYESLLRWLPAVKPKTSIIYNSVPIEQVITEAKQSSTTRLRLGVQPEQFLLLFVGRLTEAKGVDVLLRAMCLLPNKVVAVFAGWGHQSVNLKQLASQLGINQRVQFLGLRRDVYQLIGAADCVVMPSRWEGLPLVLLEAMAASKPIIATCVGEIPEVLRNGVNGVLVKPNDEHSLANGITQVLEYPDMAHQIATQAGEDAKQFSVEAIAGQYIDLYERLLRSKSS